jgi:hypothetical protein
MPASSFVAWAGSPVIGVARVTRVTEPDHTNVFATSRAPLPATPDSVRGVAGVAHDDSRAGAVTRATRASAGGVPQIDHTNQSGNPSNPGHPGDGSGAQPLAVPLDEERAALIEHEGGIPREWAEGFARLDPNRPPGDVPLRRWRTFVDDIGVFLDGRWAATAAALGWGPGELFGCDRDRPFARVDTAGLLWLLNGDTLVALSSEIAVIERVTGARQTYRRRAPRDGDVSLAWEMQT